LVNLVNLVSFVFERRVRPGAGGDKQVPDRPLARPSGMTT